MTPSRQSDIASLLTEKCQLIETAFIEEMTDHFVIAIETRMAGSLSFQQAFELTVEDFGGRRNIQKLEWAYRKVFLKNQLRTWWVLVKNQFTKPKLIRLTTVMIFVTLASFFLGTTDLVGVSERQITWFTLESGSVVPIVALTWFLLQRVVPRIRKFTIIRFPDLFRTMLSYSLVASALLLSLGIGILEMSVLFKCICYSFLWSTLATLYLGFLDYSMKTAPELWYRTKIADR